MKLHRKIKVAELTRSGIRLWSWPGTPPCEQCRNHRMHSWAQHWRLYLAETLQAWQSRKDCQAA